MRLDATRVRRTWRRTGPHAGAISQLEQLRSNFGDKLLNAINPQTGRLHGSFQLAEAKSGRFSSSSPNMQNIPKSDLIRPSSLRHRASSKPTTRSSSYG